MDALPAPFDLPYVQRGLAEMLLLSVGAGILGCWIVLRGLAFYSHAVGSAAFPGLVLADGLGFAAPLGALGAAGAFALLIVVLGGRERLGPDATTAVGLAGMLALGVILASDVFRSGAGVETLLFGSLLLVEPRDLVLAGAASAGALAATLTLGPVWLARGFDPAAAHALGLRGRLFDALLPALVALVVVAALSALGALLVAALVVVPAATVRLWIDRLAPWQAVTVALVAAEGVVGLVLSVQLNAPPGAMIATLAGAVFAVSAASRALRARGVRSAPAAAVAAGAVMTLAIAGCGDGDDSKVRVVATTTQVGDWARAVKGDGFSVHQILKPNTDPHEYEARPDDVEALANADVIFRSGGDLDEWVREAADDAGSDAELVDLSQGLPHLRRGGGELDPHWWHDPRNVPRAVLRLAEGLVRAAPSREGQVARRTRNYVLLVRAVDQEISRCMQSIPPARRKLVTDHDAFAYLAARYGLDVVGTVIPARTTLAQPSAGELGRLADTIERERVPAVFPESSVGADAARAIARQTGADASHVLYGDTLGPAGSRAANYIGMLAANADSIVRGLTGKRCRAG
jgi:ABC-type Zn uptake system ZnuABC Zn-binding protein ZnuA/ABC-type Mn2+/Zn2+ transport system permease subunit